MWDRVVSLAATFAYTVESKWKRALANRILMQEFLLFLSSFEVELIYSLQKFRSLVQITYWMTDLKQRKVIIRIASAGSRSDTVLFFL